MSNYLKIGYLSVRDAWYESFDFKTDILHYIFHYLGSGGPWDVVNIPFLTGKPGELIIPSAVKYTRVKWHLDMWDF